MRRYPWLPLCDNWKTRFHLTSYRRTTYKLGHMCPETTLCADHTSIHSLSVQHRLISASEISRHQVESARPLMDSSSMTCARRDFSCDCSTRTSVHGTWWLEVPSCLHHACASRGLCRPGFQRTLQSLLDPATRTAERSAACPSRFSTCHGRRSRP